MRLSLTLTAALTLALAGCSSTDYLVVDQASQRVYHVRSETDSVRVEPGDVVRTRHPSLPLRVVHTATPLYSYALKQTDAASPDVAAATAFLALTGGTITDVATTASVFERLFSMEESSAESLPSTDPASTDSASADLASAYAELANAMESAREQLSTIGTIRRGLTPNAGAGSLGLAQIGLDAAQSLQAIAVQHRRNPRQAAFGPVQERLRATLGPSVSYGRDSTLQLAHVAALGNAYAELRTRADAVASAARQADVAATHDAYVLLSQIVDTMGEAPTVLAGAIAVEQSVASALGAETVWRDTIRVEAFKGRAVELSVTPTKAPVLGTVSGLKPMATQFTVVRNRSGGWVRPRFGLTLAYARDAEYPAGFTSVMAADSTFTVEASETLDRRYNFLATLGLRIAPPVANSSFAVTPEVHVYPSADVRTFGFGGALEVGPLAVSAGYLWFKRDELTGGLAPGSPIVAEGGFRTAPTYGGWGGRELYLGISIRKLPPFTK